MRDSACVGWVECPHEAHGGLVGLVSTLDPPYDWFTFRARGFPGSTKRKRGSKNPETDLPLDRIERAARVTGSDHRGGIVGNEEAVALLREIRDILVAHRDLLKKQDEKYQKALDDSRQDYADQIQQSKWNRRKELMIGLLAFFFYLTVGVFIGVLVGVRLSKPWQ